MTPGSFLLGAGVLAIGAKFWMFTLGAISVIGEADLGRTDSIVTYLLFVLAPSARERRSCSARRSSPRRARRRGWTTRIGWLTRHNRMIMIVVSLCSAPGSC